MTQPPGEEGLSFLSDKDYDGHLPENEAVPVGVSSSHQLSEISFIRQSSHPVVVIFHLLFKSLALLVYLFSGLFTSSYIFVAVVVILLLAFDFWTVKNVTGRLLVGLRWWVYVKEDGSNEWVFEALENMEQINANDSRIFWLGLYAPMLVWGLLLLVDVLKLNLQWTVVVCAALSMQGANLVGYYKCSGDAKAKMQSMMAQGSAGLNVMKAFGRSSAFNSAMSGLLGTFSGSTPAPTGPEIVV